ncbi:MAG: 3-dehydroquinate synthase [Myxococcaceae bacterium]|nr:3-dehydroquinate synthase [Myxococcaceae bacterium]
MNSPSLSSPSPFARFQVTSSGAFEAALEQCLASQRATSSVIVTDATVRSLHGDRFPRGLPVVEIGEGEEAKSWQSVETIAGRLLDMGVDRQGAIIAIGGGLVCDVAAFTAAIWMRGVGCGLVPTTLLAQADAGLGGKCGINWRGHKNLIGAFRPPEFCLCDAGFLSTLSRRDLASGLSEIAKHAALFDAALFEFLRAHAEALLAADEALLAQVVERSLCLKAAVVERDPLEKGERRLLNLGHTLGHASELLLDLRHGEAVAIGMRLMARLSRERGLMERAQVERLEALLDRLELPSLNALSPLCPEQMGEALRADKKRDGDKVRCVLLNGLGEASGRVEALEIRELEAWLSRRWRELVAG